MPPSISFEVLSNSDGIWDRLFAVFYTENLLYLPFFSLSKFDGKLVADWSLMLADRNIFGCSVTGTGAYVLEAFKNSKKWIGVFCQPPFLKRGCR